MLKQTIATAAALTLTMTGFLPAMAATTSAIPSKAAIIAGLQNGKVWNANGKLVTISKDKPVLYVAPWCPHCLQEEKWLQSEKIPAKDFRVVVVWASAQNEAAPHEGLPDVPGSLNTATAAKRVLIVDENATKTHYLNPNQVDYSLPGSALEHTVPATPTLVYGNPSNRRLQIGENESRSFWIQTVLHTASANYARHVVPAPTTVTTVSASRVAGTATSLLASAKKGTNVNVEMYEFTNSTLANALISAKERGANVKVILDATYTGNRSIATHLAQAGIPVRFMSVGSDGYTDIDHVKFLQVGDTILMGGVNWGAWSGETTDRDVEFSMLGSAGQAFFADDWAQAGQHMYVRNHPVYPAKNGVQLLTDSQIEPALLQAIASARSSLVVQMFSFDDRSLIDALIAAKDRGVRVRVSLDTHYEKSIDTPAYNALKAAGIQVAWMPEDEVLHAKSVVVDGGRITMLGSANWTNSGMKYNHELDVEIVR